MKTRGFIATSMLAVAVLFLVAASALFALSIGRPVPFTFGTQPGFVVSSIGLCAYPIVGWLIVRRQPGNRIGWLFLVIGVIAGFHLGATAYSTLATRVFALPFPVAATWVGNWGWIGWIGVIATLVAPLFPDGRPAARWIWPFIGLTAVGLVAAGIGEALAPGALEVDPRFQNPFASSSPIVDMLATGLAAMPLGVLVGVISLVVRYRRGDATTRVQLRWFILTLAVVGIGFAVVLIGPSSSENAPLGFRILEDVVTFGWVLIAVVVGIAVFKYRLYAVDLVINRALVYGTLTALLAGIYLLTVVILQAAISPLAGGSEFVVAASTLTVAALFGPLRSRVQSFIDRRFYRARYDAERLLESFSARMRDEIDLDDIAGELVATVRTSIHPLSASLWLRPH